MFRNTLKVPQQFPAEIIIKRTKVGKEILWHGTQG